MRMLISGATLLLSGNLLAQDLSFDALHRMWPADAHQTSAIALGDVDGDGDLDALVGNAKDFPSNLGERNFLLLNDGTGRFAPAPGRLPAHEDDTLSLALGDVDGDGDLDAFIGNDGDDRLYLGDGRGSFTHAPHALPAIAATTVGVAFGDVDGDGDLDAFLACTSSTPLVPAQNHLYLNDGTGGFQDATARIPADADRNLGVALGDLDGDGDLDAFLAGLPVNRIYRNDGLGEFSDVTQSSIVQVTNHGSSVTLGDLDGDGDLDAVLTAESFQPNHVLLNDGAGVFRERAGALPPHLDQSMAARLGDLDGDGDLDLFVANDGLDRLYSNDGTGAFLDATYRLPANATDTEAAALGDLDGDGDLDALVGSARTLFHADRQNRIYLNDGSGTLRDATARGEFEGADVQHVVLGDVDRDGDLDALIAVRRGVHLMLGDGTGSLIEDSGSLPTILEPMEDLALGDLDGDGDLDLLVLTAVKAWLCENDGSGRYSDTSARLPLAHPGGTAMGLGDIDLDGDLDLLLADGSGAPRLFTNDGSMNFAPAAWAPPPLPAPARTLALGDLDGDGDLDALWGFERSPMSATTSPNGLHLNIGAGQFIDFSHLLPASHATTSSIALGDLDGDGDLDALFGNEGAPALTLVRNDGSGLFADAPARLPASATAALRCGGIALGDLDEDGDLDAWVGIASGAPNARDLLLLNDDGAGLVDARGALPDAPDTTQAVALGDLDLDGDLDALLGTRVRTRLLSNLRLQLSWRALPRLDHPLALELRGPRSGGWSLVWSLREARIPIPLLGVLGLDPGAMHCAARGMFDGSGRAEVVYPAPRWPLVLGLELHWQALAIWPARLTNPERTIIGT